MAVWSLFFQPLTTSPSPRIVERADVRMIEAGDRLRFAIEALLHVGVTGKVHGQNLDGDRAVQARVRGLIDLALSGIWHLQRFEVEGHGTLCDASDVLRRHP